MAQKACKWGNSLAVRIPRDAAARAGIEPGDSLSLSVAPGKITFVKGRRPLRIEDLLDKMTPENQPEFIDWGPPRGKEFW
ncbi:MAG TPA: AbrB/MazE/SpoVT family DNA-binding domain-containing protein [Rhizomicrobium sp.]|jgi:antitoxin MazE